jgi:hypothetical protein
MLRKLGPAFEAMLTCNDELCIGKKKFATSKLGLRQLRETRMVLPHTLERVGIAIFLTFEESLRLFSVLLQAGTRR